MKRQQVQSSNLQSVGYATDSKELHVEFKGGKVFKYLDVPESDYQDMMGCKSIGSYFARIIRKNYQAEQVIEEATEDKNNASS